MTSEEFEVFFQYLRDILQQLRKQYKSLEEIENKLDKIGERTEKL